MDVTTFQCISFLSQIIPHKHRKMDSLKILKVLLLSANRNNISMQTATASVSNLKKML